MAGSTSISARPQTPADADFIEDLVIAVRENELGYRELPPTERNKLLREQNHLQLAHYLRVYPQAHYSIIEADKKPIGRLYVDQSPTHIHIVELSILPDFQGHGIGKTYVESIMAESIRTKVPITLSVTKDNSALRFYEKLGFQTRKVTSPTHHVMYWKPLEI